MPRDVLDEVLVIDDGSTDRSADVAREQGATAMFRWLVLLLTVTVALPIPGYPRYHAVADPFFVFLVAITLTSVGERRRRRGVRRTEPARL